MANNTDKSLIFRYYFNRRINILGGTENIHDALFSKQGDISNYDRKHAELLTRFFTYYKREMARLKSGQGTIGDYIEFQTMGSTIKVPSINFALGGNASDKETSGGGLLFEKEIQYLIDKNFKKTGEDTNSSLGTVTANASLFLFEDQSLIDASAEKIEEIAKEQLGQKLDEILKQTEGKLTIDTSGKVYLMAAQARFGKIDVMNNGDRKLNIQIEGSESSELAQVKAILSNASFSVKSYTTKSAPHLGETVGEKAISAIASYVNTEWAKGAALYYLHHPTKGSDKKITPAQKPTEKEIYQHYNHMKKTYELAGLGLDYSDLGKRNVDFLLVNEARGNKIAVYSTKDLIRNMTSGGRYTYKSIYSKYNI